MRVTIDVREDWQVRYLNAAGQELAPARLLRSLAVDGGPAYPFSPGGEPSEALAGCALCDATPAQVAETFDEVTGRQVQNQNHVELGRYLFATLIGPAWSALEQAVAQDQSQTLELALRAPQGMADFHRLPWELMCRPPAAGGEPRFLAGGKPRLVALTRLVAGAMQAAPPLNQPPRMLFVVGADLNDPSVRPGAEYFGMLRHISHRNRVAHHRVLQYASPESLQAAIKQFRPDLVHFICHGWTDEGGAFLQLVTKESGADPRRYARHLLADLTTDENLPLPPVVVLSACYSGAPLSTAQTGSLAAQLVAGGVPVVVGMSGQVADLACRLFTRQLAASLVGGEPLVRATALGRSAVFYGGQQYLESVDWALPTVFMAEGVDRGFIPYQPAADDLGQQVEDRVAYFGLPATPHFCGRQAYMDPYYRLVEPTDKLATLAIYTESAQRGVGKTRLLEEMTALAVRDSHIPILLRSIPKSTAEFAHLLIAAIETTYGAYGLKVTEDEQLHLLTTLAHADLLTAPALDVEVRRLVQRGQGITPAALLAALRCDLATLRRAVYDEYPSIQQAGGQVLLLLDDIDQYGDDDQAGTSNLAAGSLLAELTANFRDRFGLGIQGLPIPTVVTFAYGGAAKETLKHSLVESGKLGTLSLKLYPFQPVIDGKPVEEDILVYKLTFLHPPPGQESKRYTFNQRQQPELMEAYKCVLRNDLKGIPDNLREEKLDSVRYTGVAFKCLVQANDEQVLAAILGNDNGRGH
jgi:hypothetical protein